MGPLSIKAPIRATPAMDMKKEMTIGTLQKTTRLYMNMPPREINSHWAKLTIPVALWMILKPMATMAYMAPMVKPVMTYWAICCERSMVFSVLYYSYPEYTIDVEWKNCRQ